MAEQPPRGREANIDALHEHIREELPEEAREQLLEMMIGDTDIENMCKLLLSVSSKSLYYFAENRVMIGSDAMTSSCVQEALIKP